MELLALFAEINVCLILFALAYQFIFRKLTFYSYNRIYLLGALIISILIPLSEIEVVRQGPNESPPSYMFGEKLPGNTISVLTSDISHEEITDRRSIDWELLLTWTYLLITSILLVRLLWLIREILKYSKGGVVLDGFRVVSPYKGFRNCSFFNLLFIDITQLSGSNTTMIVAHEKEHALRLHSADKILIEIIHCFLWASPVIYYYRKVMAENHEFQVDQAASRTCNKEDYASFLLSLTVQTNRMVTNGLNSGSLKARVKMLFGKPSHKTKKSLYFFTLPLLAGLTWFFTVDIVYAAMPLTSNPAPGRNDTDSVSDYHPEKSAAGDNPDNIRMLATVLAAGKTIGSKKAMPAQRNQKIAQHKRPNEGPVRILLDPGHGGKDPGGVALSTNEKDIVLHAAQRLKKLLEAMGVVVHLTRETDEYMSLRDRVSIGADEADLFISLHMQLAAKGKNMSGLQICHSTAQKNEAGREGSLQLANSIYHGLASTQKLIVHENLDVPLMVLRTPEIPAVLLQLGFLTDQGDLSSVYNSDRLEYIADVIYRSATEISASK